MIIYVYYNICNTNLQNNNLIFIDKGIIRYWLYDPSEVLIINLKRFKQK